MTHLFGIRHHGPGCARSLVRALEELSPDCVLIEGPPEAEAVLAAAIHAEIEPPVALLGHVIDEPRRAVFAPLASFSPEWQAIRWANEHDVPVEAIDLPLAHTLALPDDDSLVVGDAPSAPIAALGGAAGARDAEARAEMARQCASRSHSSARAARWPIRTAPARQRSSRREGSTSSSMPVGAC